MTSTIRSQRGAVSTELAVLTPLLIGFMLLVVFAGRVAQTEGDVAHAAQEAARAASLVGSAGAAVEAGEETAAANIATGAVACRHLEVSVDTTNFGAEDKSSSPSPVRRLSPTSQCSPSPAAAPLPTSGGRSPLLWR